MHQLSHTSCNGGRCAVTASGGGVAFAGAGARHLDRRGRCVCHVPLLTTQSCEQNGQTRLKIGLSSGPMYFACHIV